MPTKIYHKDHGIVITNNPDEIAEILAKGGVKVIKNKELLDPPKPELPPARTKDKRFLDK